MGPSPVHFRDVKARKYSGVVAGAGFLDKGFSPPLQSVCTFTFVNQVRYSNIKSGPIERLCGQPETKRTEKEDNLWRAFFAVLCIK